MQVVPMTPINELRVLQNVPLDPSYSDTLTFPNLSTQVAYFTTKMKGNAITNMSPIRINNIIRLPFGADFMYNCNYVMFKNANFSQKWFFAFIKKVDYVNTNSCDILIELDVMQTWKFDVQINQCYVEREHTNDDTRGVNLQVEDVDLGAYRQRQFIRTETMNKYAVVLATSYLLPSLDYKVISGVYQGVTFLMYDIDSGSDIEALNEVIKKLTEENKADSIVSIFMMPWEYVTNSSEPIIKDFSVLKRDTVGDYTPRNNKLLCYPYNFLNVFTPNGANMLLRYEFFSDTNCRFKLKGAMTCSPQILLQPVNYQNQANAIEESMTLTDFPQCSYAIDSFKAYLAQNSVSSLIKVGGSVGAIASGNFVSGSLGLASSLNDVVVASMRPPLIKGVQQTDVYTGTRAQDFYFCNNYVDREHAESIDSYFDTYGYSTNKVKIPNIEGRPSWNYVKTRNSKVTGLVPAEDLTKIRNIFNTGITFWHGDYVGDYSRNNRI